MIDTWVLAFIVALLFSWLVSKCASKFLESKYIISNYSRLDYYIFDDAISLVAKYFPSLIFVNRAEFITMPSLSPRLLMSTTRKQKEIAHLLNKRKLEALQIRKLEIVANAMDRDRSDAKHGSLYDSLYSHIAPLKQEFRNLFIEGHELSIMIDLNSGGYTTSSEFLFRYENLNL